MSLIETAFADAQQTLPKWVSNTFSAQERRDWAVIDLHWYTAWSGDTCSGRVVSGGGYFCDEPIEHIRERLRGCVDYFGRAFSTYTNGLKACSEFSLGTFEDAVLACNDEELLRMFLDEQVRAFRIHDITAFFWTWRMPYGPTFQRGWSLKHIAGFEQLPPSFSCSKLGPGSAMEM